MSEEHTAIVDLVVAEIGDDCRRAVSLCRDMRNTQFKLKRSKSGSRRGLIKLMLQNSP